MADMPKCETCWFFVADADRDEPGRCHRYPPAVVAYPGSRSSTHPIVCAEDWCGEHQPSRVAIQAEREKRDQQLGKHLGWMFGDTKPPRPADA